MSNYNFTVSTGRKDTPSASTIPTVRSGTLVFLSVVLLLFIAGVCDCAPAPLPRRDRVRDEFPVGIWQDEEHSHIYFEFRNDGSFFEYHFDIIFIGRWEHFRSVFDGMTVRTESWRPGKENTKWPNSFKKRESRLYLIGHTEPSGRYARKVASRPCTTNR
jgi:hypothetical protein